MISTGRHKSISLLFTGREREREERGERGERERERDGGLGNHGGGKEEEGEQNPDLMPTLFALLFLFSLLVLFPTRRETERDPNQQRTLNKLPPELRRRNFVAKHRLSMQVGAQTCEKRVCDVYVF